jgi:guanosine-3',5'-bis(diphosphate) 3'-pyrophosphohydrolase
MAESQSLESTYRGLLEAAAFAARAHRGQLRKDKETPYVSHVFRVCLVAREIFGISDPRVLMTALLHDTVEDTTTDFDDLEEHFGREIAAWVAFLSKDKRLPEQEREQAYIDNLAKAPWPVLACKLADIFDNLMDLGQMPPERRQHTLNRLEGYVNALRGNTTEHLRRPLALVSQLLEEMKLKNAR